MKQQVFKPLPHFDTYTVDFDSSNRPECFHLFWRDREVATIRLAYDSNGYLNKAIRQDTRDQRLISLKELANLPFFTAYIHRINLIDEITLLRTLQTLSEVTNIKNIESIDLIDEITAINEIKDLKTIDGINLVIDKLTQNAYTEDRRTLENNGATPTMATCGTYAKAKFFPRGCRGFINYIQVYSDNLDSSNPHTLTIKFSPLLGFGEVITKTLELPASTSAEWQTVFIKQMWNYDSMFIWVQSDSNTYGRVGSDNGTPYDYYYSSDAITWTVGSARYWFKLNMVGETVGDLPVSGTINVIEIPSVSQERLLVQDTSLLVGETSIKVINGCGTLKWIEWRTQAATDSHKVNCRILCDGNIAFSYGLSILSSRGYTASTPLISLLKYAENGDCVLSMSAPFNFQRELEICGCCYGLAGIRMDVEGLVDLVK